MGIRNWFRRKEPVAAVQRKSAVSGKKTTGSAKPASAVKPAEVKSSEQAAVVKPVAAKPTPFAYSNEALWQLGGKYSTSFVAECKRLNRMPVNAFRQLLREIETNPNLKKQRAEAMAIHRKIWMEDSAYLDFRSRLDRAIQQGAFKEKKEALRKNQKKLEDLEIEKTIQEGRELARLFAEALHEQPQKKPKAPGS